MLKIFVPGGEYFDESIEEFVDAPDYTLELEHSLVSLSKWEQIYEKPYISEDEKTIEEVKAYLYAMIVTPKDVPENVIDRLTSKDLERINTYINAKQTATWFSDSPKSSRNREVITSELIYYWMITAGISKDYETWPLSRLFTLLKVFELKNSEQSGKPKKLTDDDLARRREINKQRKRDLGTNG